MEIRNRELKIIKFFIFILFLLLLYGNSKNKFIKIYFPNGNSVIAELAITEEEKTRGLMFREKIEDNQGMLFIFKAEGFYSFWMKNMNFPIDMIWLDKEKRIVYMKENVPPCKKDPCPSYISLLPAKYVLELKSGKVKKEKLKLYDKLNFSIKYEQ